MQSGTHAAISRQWGFGYTIAVNPGTLASIIIKSSNKSIIIFIKMLLLIRVQMCTSLK